MPLPRPDTHRIVVHLDYDCFYASVIEARNPHLRGKPLGVQQKQIIVTCNYEARRRGLRKLQLIEEARKVCPDVIIALGEDLTLFRDASKELYAFAATFSWNGKAERLGLDEVFLDVSDVISYNARLINRHNLESSFFHLSKDDPTLGFPFNATGIAGHGFPATASDEFDPADADLRLRLVLGSHLANHIREKLEREKGYTCSVGISTSKVLSKLVGNVNKPHAQTTLLPPYASPTGALSSINELLDPLEVGKIPGIGFRTATKLRELVLKREVQFEEWAPQEPDCVDVHMLRHLPGINEAVLERQLAGPGAQKGIGAHIWKLLHGIDDSEVAAVREVPRQISIEDSYSHLTSLDEATEEMRKLTESMLNRMRMDLLDSDRTQWLARPKNIRLSTRPRLPIGPDGTRPRTHTRISRSAAMPSFALDLDEPIEFVARKLVSSILIGMFRQLHPKSGWNLSLINIAVTNIQEVAGSGRGTGRDIGQMFLNQDAFLANFKAIGDTVIPEDRDVASLSNLETKTSAGSEDMMALSQSSQISTEEPWEDDDSANEAYNVLCMICDARMPAFALDAHVRFHERPD